MTPRSVSDSGSDFNSGSDHDFGSVSTKEMMVAGVLVVRGGSGSVGCGFLGCGSSCASPRKWTTPKRPCVDDVEMETGHAGGCMF